MANLWHRSMSAPSFLMASNALIALVVKPDLLAKNFSFNDSLNIKHGAMSTNYYYALNLRYAIPLTSTTGPRVHFLMGKVLNA